MKKLLVMLLLAAFSLSTFAGMTPQQDTTKKVHKHKNKPKSKVKKSTKTDTTRTDTLRKPQP
jgi:Ni/Co efflux regulator RcnB